MHGLWPSGPLAPSPPPQYTEGSLPVPPRPRVNASLTRRERGFRGISPRRPGGHEQHESDIIIHPALCLGGLAGPLSCLPGEATAHSHTTHGISLISVDIIGFTHGRCRD